MKKERQKKKVAVYSWLHTHSLSSGTILASLCLELSSTRFNRAQPNTIEMWKNHLIPDTAVFHYAEPAIVAQIHAFHVALYCLSECDDFTCLSTGACIIIWQCFCCCLLNLKQTEKEAFQLFTFHNFTRSEPTHMKSGPRYPTEYFHWTGFNNYLL